VERVDVDDKCRFADDNTWLVQCWFYLRLGDHTDLNYYAYPLDLCAEVDEDLKVTKVYRLPLSPDERISNEQRPFDLERIHSTAASEYHPDLRPSPRTTTKPYQVVQPEGPSFSIEGQKVSWEKWSFRVGFNYREGLTLHDIRYDERSLFYRLSLAEMFVPYGDPRAPYPRKAAFDLGNDGAGINANNLQLGCDCLGRFEEESVQVMSLIVSLTIQAPSSTSTPGTTTPKARQSSSPT
jgi:primary-amine oxidase